VRLCCSLCLLEHDPEIISLVVLSKDRDRFDQTGDQKYVDKAHRRGKVGWDVGRHVDVAPHYLRPHMMLAWRGRAGRSPRSCRGGQHCASLLRWKWCRVGGRGVRGTQNQRSYLLRFPSRAHRGGVSEAATCEVAKSCMDAST
jgi:hypothetical protein